MHLDNSLKDQQIRKELYTKLKDLKDSLHESWIRNAKELAHIIETDYKVSL